MQFSEERFLAKLEHIGDVLERIADALGDIAKERQAQSAIERLLALDVLPPGLDWKQIGVVDQDKVRADIDAAHAAGRSYRSTQPDDDDHVFTDAEGRER